jgi:Pregnancy-associated plasma protein-A/Secretion system C-terminal sorting domain
MRTYLFGICILLSFFSVAQNRCATSDYIETLKAADPTLRQRLLNLEHLPQLTPGSTVDRVHSSSREDNSLIIRIPVIVHIVYSSAGQNVTDEQVKSQIDALNRDYRRQNADTLNTPDRFRSVAADVRIKFVLATADPNGRATTGIIRKSSGKSYWDSDDQIKYSSKGGDDAWDSKFYLNIWVGNLRGLLGYSSVPGCAPAIDGVVISTGAFGTINMPAHYNLGRTAVHEVGHWLGLKHIWGDTYCGNDLVDDTPKQGNFTAGCPGGFRSSCDNGTLGDMYMNYMDFTDDGCMNLFTAGQRERMRAQFQAGGPRNELLVSKGLNAAWNTAPVTDNNKETETPTVTIAKAQLYPNPAGSDMTLSLDASWVGKTVQILTINGVPVRNVQVTSRQQKLDLRSLAPGMYLISGIDEGTRIREKFVKM